MNILISAAGRRVSLVNAFKTELKKHFEGGKVYTTDLNPKWSSACNISDGNIELPRVGSPDYLNKLLEVCIKNNIKMIIPTIDTELLQHAQNKDILKENGIDVIVSNIEFIKRCRDKRISNILFEELNISIPKPVSSTSPTFPLFAKPYNGSLSKNIHVINSAEDLSATIINDASLMWMEYLNPLEYQEYTVDAYYDIDSNLQCLVPRIRVETRGGEISKGKTDKGILYKVLISKLRYLKRAHGCLTLQFFVHKSTDEVIGIEINPRFGGGYPLTYFSGGNYPEFLIKEYFLKEKIVFSDNWIDGRIMLRYDAEIIIDEH